MTDLMPRAVLPPDIGFTDDQLHDAFYVVHRAASALGRQNHGPRIVNTRWDLDTKHFGAPPRRHIVIRCIFVVKENHFRSRYVTHAAGQRHGVAIFDTDRARLETLIRDTFEARQIACDTLYVGIAQGNL